MMHESTLNREGSTVVEWSVFFKLSLVSKLGSDRLLENRILENRLHPLSRTSLVSPVGF